MRRDLLQSAKVLLAEKRALAASEQRLIGDLNRVLPAIGYRVVTRAPLAKAASRSADGAMPLACPRCSRRFAHPLHLGRHLSATHGRKKGVA